MTTKKAAKKKAATSKKPDAKKALVETAKALGDKPTMKQIADATKKPAKTKKPISAVNRIKDLAEKTTDVNWLDPRMIKYEKGHNPRDYTLPENRTHLDTLKKSIKLKGVLVPLLVRYESGTKEAIVVDGECRLRAALELIKEGKGGSVARIKTVQVPGGDEKERLMTAIIANQGKPFSKWEIGAAFNRLDSHGMTLDEIVAETGYTERFVKEAMELADASLEMKQMLSSQAVTPAEALSSMRKHGTTKAVKEVKKKIEKHKAAGKKGPVKKDRKTEPVHTIKAVAKSTIEKAARTLLNSAITEIKEAEKGKYEYVAISLSMVQRLRDAFGE